MAMKIRKATIDDLNEIMMIIDEGRKTMVENGNVNQWQKGYPKTETIVNDIENGNCYLCEDNGINVGTFAFINGPDKTYKTIYQGEWIDDTLPYSVIHRIASTQGSHGVFNAIIGFCTERSKNIRVDTHRDNKIMQHNLLKHGFCYCGIIYLENGDERLAYQRTANP